MKLASLAVGLIATVAQYGVLAAATHSVHATGAYTSKAPWSMGPLQARVGWPSKTPVGPVWLNANQRGICGITEGNELACSSAGTGLLWKKGHNPWLDQSAEACDVDDGDGKDCGYD